jgi:hypothetical protein
MVLDAEPNIAAAADRRATAVSSKAQLQMGSNSTLRLQQVLDIRCVAAAAAAAACILRLCSVAMELRAA